MVTVAKRHSRTKITKSRQFLILLLLSYTSTHMSKCCHAFQLHPHRYSISCSHRYRLYYHVFPSYLGPHRNIPTKTKPSYKKERRKCTTTTSLSSRDTNSDDPFSNIEQNLESSSIVNENITDMTTQQRIEIEKWGVTHQETPSTPTCPHTLDDVVQASFNAISSTLYNKQSLDPNLLVNVMAKSYMDKRPVGFMYGEDAGRDVGRLGIEIDGARFLLDGGTKLLDLNGESDRRKARIADLEGHAMRRLSLKLAARLSSSPWEGLEGTETTHGSDNNSDELNDVLKARSSVRPVALYFNTIRQALLANLELKVLKEQSTSDVYANIRILCLGQDTIPDDMLSGKKTMRRHRRMSDLIKGKILPQNGIILIVQPSDYNAENLPPSPAVGSISALQVLLAQASIVRLPSIVISPRLTEHINPGFGDSSRSDQSGYQQSSTYGGVEPPKGPTPWLLRDFIPPVFSWIGCVVPLIKRRPSPALSRLQVETDSPTEKALKDRKIGKVDVEQRYFSRISMTQSILESGHPWHLFAVEEIHQRTLLRKKDRQGPDISLLSNFFCHNENRKINHQYLASTSPSAGRPTSKVAKEIFSIWS